MSPVPVTLCVLVMLGARVAQADPIVYDLVAEPTLNGSTVVGWIEWDSGATGLTLEDATTFSFRYGPGPALLSFVPAVFDPSDDFHTTAQNLVGSLGDATLLPNEGHVWWIYDAAALQSLNLVDFTYPTPTSDAPQWYASHRVTAEADRTDQAAPIPDWKLVRRPYVIPEPSTLALMGLGLGLLAWRMRRRKRAA